MKGMVNTYTSTGIKLVNHPTVIRNIKIDKKATPVSIQIAPTSRCNLNCVFCSNVNRDKHEDLELDLVLDAMKQLRTLGAKTVEWTGGGDPSLYENINEVIAVANMLGYKQGFISNGVATKKMLSDSSLKKLTWLRISMNCLDYMDNIEIPRIDGTLGFSYVMNEKTKGNILSKLDNYVAQYNPSYVRIVPNCQSSDEEQEENNKRFASMVHHWGYPYFYQKKTFEKPERCWWGYFKPFLLHDGFVYPCSSVVLNADAERKFHEQYRITKIENVEDLYKGNMVPFSSEHCNHCVFKTQNGIIESLVNPNGMEEFI